MGTIYEFYIWFIQLFISKIINSSRSHVYFYLRKLPGKKIFSSSYPTVILLFSVSISSSHFLMSRSLPHFLKSGSPSSIWRYWLVEKYEYKTQRLITLFSKQILLSWFREFHNTEDDNLRYIHLQTSINPDILQEVCDFSTNLFKTDKYSTLKSSIIHKYSYAESCEDKIIHLIEQISLGDRWLSDLLGELVFLPGSGLSETVLRTIFLKTLPENLAVILASTTELLTMIGESANRISVFQQNSPATVAAY